MKKIGRDDRVGYSGFIFQTQKPKSFRRSRTLSGNDATSDTKTLAAGQVAEFAGPPNAHGIEPLAAVSHGMRPHGEAGAVEVSNQALLVIHGLERRRRIKFGQFFQ